MTAQAKVKNKGRKIGRNAKYCEVYRQLNTRLKNKLKKIRRHIKKFPEDRLAASALQRLS